MFVRNSFVTGFVVVVVLAAAGAVAAEVTAERSEAGVKVQIDGKPFTEYLVRSGTKPILWPILGPTGKAMTRAWPMLAKTGEKNDHPHQRSLWFSYGNVNGVDFWTEKGGKVGTIKHREFVKIQSGPPAVIVARDDWLGPKGEKLCEDERTLVFGAEGAARWIDFRIAIKASEGPVTLGDTKEGAFAVRVPDTMRVDAKLGGRIVNSEGRVDRDAWAQPAAWVDYHGPVDGETLGIAILNHPRSFRFPTYWHVRTYGLFAANPFGLNEFTGGKRNGKHTIPAGQSMMLRYRVVLHRGDEKAGRIAELFATYAKEE